MTKSLEKIVLGASTLLSLSGCRNLPALDTGIDPSVVLYPSTPSVEDDLHCRVDNSEDYLFDFYWLVNKHYISVEESVPAGSLGSVFFQKGDYVECSAWVPASAGYTSYEIGSDAVYIE